jgi:hypothetical protein
MYTHRFQTIFLKILNKMKYINLLLLLIFLLSIYINVISDNLIQRTGALIAMTTMLILLLYKNDKKKS